MESVSTILQHGGPLFTAIGGILVALIAILAKRTPEKKDSNEVMQSSINLLSARIDALEKSNKALWDDVEQLRKRVSYLWQALETAKSYIRFLEERIEELVGSKPDRPDDVDRFMEE